MGQANLKMKAEFRAMKDQFREALNRMDDLEQQLAVATEAGTLKREIRVKRDHLEENEAGSQVLQDQVLSMATEPQHEQENELIYVEPRAVKDFLNKVEKFVKIAEDSAMVMEKKKAEILSQKLSEELKAAQTSVALYENRMEDMEMKHHEELERVRIECQKLVEDARTKAFEDLNNNRDTLIAQYDEKLKDLMSRQETLQRELKEKDQVIEEYVQNANLTQAKLTELESEIERKSSEIRKIKMENRSLNVEKQHLLAKMAADKDKTEDRNRRWCMAREAASTSDLHGKAASTSVNVFKDPKLLGHQDMNISRRDFVSSIASSNSVHTGRESIPHGAGRFLDCDEEDGAFFGNSYLNDLGSGNSAADDPNSSRLRELHRRNTLQLPHMRSAYPVEACNERLRIVLTKEFEIPQKRDERIENLTSAAARLDLDTPPAANTRRRRSQSLSDIPTETFVSGNSAVDDPNSSRLRELHRRNALQPPHMRSSYPVEACNEQLKIVRTKEFEIPQKRKKDECIEAPLDLDLPRAANTRRRSQLK